MQNNATVCKEADQFKNMQVIAETLREQRKCDSQKTEQGTKAYDKLFKKVLVNLKKHEKRLCLAKSFKLYY